MRAFSSVLQAVGLTMAVALGCGSSAFALSLEADTGPAERPPSSFKGTQFVDSRGCAYIRAGFAGNVEWVPRVSRSREVLCGLTPTFAASAASEQPAPAAVAPVTVKATPPVKVPPAPRVVTPVAPTPVQAVRAAPAPKIPQQDALTAARRADACGGRAVLSARWLGEGSRMAVKCGAQTTATKAPVVTQAATPRKIPAGYELAWNDDRLNPNRGKGTAAGDAAMNAIWAQTVPRRLLTAEEAAKQKVDTKSSLAPYKLSSKSPAPREVPKGSYIQVGSFGVAANMEKTVRTLQSLGYGARVTRSGKLHSVAAGPFADQAALTKALGRLRRAGYADAFVR